MYSLTREEYEQLPLETAQVVGKDDQYLVTIEMFHQIHCLVSLSSAAQSMYITNGHMALELSERTGVRYI
jgi:Mycotoxin biosynthesis protein UstYa